MNYYVYDSNADLHHLGEQQSVYAAHQAALKIFGPISLKEATVVSERQIMASAVTARMMANGTITPAKTHPPKVQAMETRGGNEATNQFIVYDGKGNTYFQSYSSVIAREDAGGNITLDERTWNYSRTTGQYRNQFLNEGIASTRAKLKSGEYTLANLN
jgi:hypothetical protein